MTSRTLCLGAFSLLVQGCAGAPGTQPHDMSASHHEAAASQEERAAAEHAGQHDPAATTTRERCRRGGKGAVEPICWTSTVNPTKQHLHDAEEHRRVAEQHRAAAQSLRSAEEKVCGGIAPEDRDTSPFSHREDMVRVERIEDPGQGKSSVPELRGATIVFRAVPGLTAEWFQRLVDCHIARNAALGHGAPDMAHCPLALKDVTASVTSTGDGFAVAVRSTDHATAEEILRRARAHLPP